jgi:hypothetical protein
MRINKFKALSIAVCCLVTSLWSEAQCMMNFEPEPGITYNLKSVSSGGFLDGRHATNLPVTVQNRDPQGDRYFQWDIRKMDGYYVLKSVSSGGFLDGRHATNLPVTVQNRDPQGDRYFQWDIRMVDGHYALKSVSSGGLLDGRHATGLEVTVQNRDPQGDLYLQWNITKGR